ncbi:phospho-sugar mutase [Microbacterium sp. ZW CA_36]|uniref:phospho-sugar mutase n=1 Tax=Microbacterium sp. ZW CA_36 TaxID=3378078 RepID=UPI003853FEE6
MSSDGERFAALRDAVQAWVSQDPDEVTRADLVGMLEQAVIGDADAVEELRDRFHTRLEFGTAGLRGRQAGGPNRMNRVVVAQTAEGLARFLTDSSPSPSIVIGYDARHNSAQYAQDTAEIMAGHGIETLLLPRPLPTPVLAFAVRSIDRSAGVMVTASHNPPQDNGYKVYLGGANLGAQIVSPQDALIAARIDEAASESIVTYARSEEYSVGGDELVQRYIVRATETHTTDDASLRYVYTAMHGVGWETARAVFTRAGFSEPIGVAAQNDPDPDFPTVAFPNPEEPGALDLAIRTAADSGADLIIANDPDADRLAVAAPFRDGWRRLTGNEIGALLGWRAAVKHTTTRGRPAPPAVLATSLVSSPALEAVARTFGLGYVETLTGFKWISRVPDLLFGFEEALGFLVDPVGVRDKDGITAAREFLALATELKAGGVSIEESLDRFASLFGGHASEQVSARVENISLIAALTASLRQDPPTQIGDLAVTGIRDYRDGIDQFPASDILRYDLERGGRVIVRPSGTEPKLKAYIDARSDVGRGDRRRAAAAETARYLADAVTVMLSERA